MWNRDMIVMGASSGGIKAYSMLLSQLPADLPAAVLAVQHTSPHAPSILPEILGRYSHMPVLAAENGVPIRYGHVYVAPPDYHMLVNDSQVELSHGPHENRVRPAIDVLFRSAAIAYRSRVIGVVLSGSLDDGTAGLMAIKRVGGLAIVQDPEDAEYPGMPQSALEYVTIDFHVPLRKMGGLLSELVRQPAPEFSEVPEDLIMENRFLNGHMSGMPPQVSTTPSSYTCPECGGVLYEIRDGDLRRYRCWTGHAYGPQTLVEAQDEGIEQALWAAIRVMESRARACEDIAKEQTARGHTRLAGIYTQRAHESREHAHVLRQLVMAKSTPPVAES